MAGMQYVMTILGLLSSKLLLLLLPLFYFVEHEQLSIDDKMLLYDDTEIA